LPLVVYEGGLTDGTEALIRDREPGHGSAVFDANILSQGADWIVPCPDMKAID